MSGQRQIRPGHQLLDRWGGLVAGSGERVDADHPDVLAHTDIETISFMVRDEPAPAPLAAAEESPPVEQPTVHPLRFARRGKAADEEGPGP